MAVLELFNAFPDEAAASDYNKPSGPGIRYCPKCGFDQTRVTLNSNPCTTAGSPSRNGSIPGIISASRETCLRLRSRHYNPTVGCFGSGAQHKFMYTKRHPLAGIVFATEPHSLFAGGRFKGGVFVDTRVPVIRVPPWFGSACSLGVCGV